MFHEGNQCRRLPSPFPQVRHIPLKIQLVGLYLNVRSVCTHRLGVFWFQMTNDLAENLLAQQPTFAPNFVLLQ